MSHSIEETHAIESNCRVSVESQLNGNPSQPQSGLDPVGDYSDRRPREPETSELAERSFSEDPRTETLTYEDQDIEPQAEGLDTITETETDSEPQAIPEPNEEPVLEVDPPAVPPSSSNGQSTAEREHKQIGSRAHDREVPQTPSSDEHLGELRQRIVNGGKNPRPSGGWVKGLFRGVFR